MEYDYGEEQDPQGEDDEEQEQEQPSAAQDASASKGTGRLSPPKEAPPLAQVIPNQAPPPRAASPAPGSPPAAAPLKVAWMPGFVPGQFGASSSSTAGSSSVGGPCTNFSCIAAEMLKQRIRFEGLDANEQGCHAKTLHKQAVRAQKNLDANGSLSVLFLATAWLQHPQPTKQVVNRAADNQKWVRSSVAGALTSLAQFADVSRDMIAPAIETLAEILRTRRVELRDAVGSEDWLCINQHVQPESMGDSMGKGTLGSSGGGAAMGGPGYRKQPPIFAGVQIKREPQEPAEQNPFKASLRTHVTAHLPPDEVYGDQDGFEEEEEEEDQEEEEEEEQLPAAPMMRRREARGIGMPPHAPPLGLGAGTSRSSSSRPGPPLHHEQLLPARRARGLKRPAAAHDAVQRVIASMQHKGGPLPPPRVRSTSSGKFKMTAQQKAIASTNRPSGVKQVCWNRHTHAWVCQYKDPNGYATGKNFSIRKIMAEDGLDFTEADKLAFESCLAFRKELVSQGVLDADTTPAPVHIPKAKREQTDP